MAKKEPAHTRSNVRTKVPRSHAEGKPVRGVRPGVRGPAKKADELKAEEMGVHKVIIIPTVPRSPENIEKGNANLIVPHGRVPVNEDKNRNRKLNRQLQDLIREIGNEVVPNTEGWTRIITVIRRLYLEAANGKVAATALLLERGWGKVPTPVQMDMKAEVMQIMESTGLTRDELASDPILKELMNNAIDADFRDADQGTNARTGDAAQ